MARRRFRLAPGCELYMLCARLLGGGCFGLGAVGGEGEEGG